jgi:hypothetical protein
MSADYETPHCTFSQASLNNVMIPNIVIDDKTLLYWRKKINWTSLNQTPSFLM